MLQKTRARRAPRLQLRHCVASSPLALEAAAAAAPARQSLRGATRDCCTARLHAREAPPPLESEYDDAIRRSSFSQANTSTATWADLPEKAEAKDAAGAEASEEVEMDVDAAGAGRASVER